MNTMRTLCESWAPLRRTATLLLAMAQVLLAFAPLTEARFGADARSHIEAAGTSTHHAHGSADCTACMARGLVASPGNAAHAEIATSRSTLPPPSLQDKKLDARVKSRSMPRAPPFGQA